MLLCFSEHYTFLHDHWNDFTVITMIVLKLRRKGYNIVILPKRGRFYFVYYVCRHWKRREVWQLSRRARLKPPPFLTFPDVVVIESNANRYEGRPHLTLLHFYRRRRFFSFFFFSFVSSIYIFHPQRVTTHLYHSATPFAGLAPKTFWKSDFTVRAFTHSCREPPNTAAHDRCRRIKRPNLTKLIS